MIIQVSCLQRGRALCRWQPQIEYSYEMPIGRNGYSVKIPDGLAVTGYSGTLLLLHPEAFDLAGLVVRTDELHAVSSARGATSEVTYKRHPTTTAGVGVSNPATGTLQPLSLYRNSRHLYPERAGHRRMSSSTLKTGRTLPARVRRR
jgi:hypothetical protein